MVYVEQLRWSVSFGRRSLKGKVHVASHLITIKCLSKVCRSCSSSGYNGRNQFGRRAIASDINWIARLEWSYLAGFCLCKLFVLIELLYSAVVRMHSDETSLQPPLTIFLRLSCLNSFLSWPLLTACVWRDCETVGQVTGKTQLTGRDFWYLTPSLSLSLTLHLTLTWKMASWVSVLLFIKSSSYSSPQSINQR